jgi:large subunit ribosomal protein L30
METKKTAAKAPATLKVQYYRSAIGFNVDQKLTVKGLGFRKLNTTREVADTPSIRGMLKKIPHLVRIVK